MDITQPFEGFAQLQYELKIASRTFPLYSNVVRLEDAIIEESVYDSSSTIFTFRTSSIDYVDRVMALNQAQGTPIMRWRLGFGAGDDVKWLPWQLNYVYKFTAKQEGVGEASGHYVAVHTKDLLGIGDRGSQTKAHRGSVSQIVHRIVGDQNDMVIEPTTGDGLWIQSYESDTEFIRQRIVRLARNSKGRGNYLFFTRDNVIHFHSPEYQARVLDLAYNQSSGMRLALSDNSQTQVGYGASGVRLILQDPYTGTSKEIESDPNLALRLADYIHRLDKIPGGDTNVMWHLGMNRPEEPGNLAQNQYEASRLECFELQLTVQKLHVARAGDFLRVTISPSESASSTWGGVYLVVNAKHAITRGAIQSVYTLRRGEYNSSPSVPPELHELGVDALKNEQKAEGVPLNVRAAQDSALTRSEGKSLTDGVYLTVQDPNKAIKPQT